MHQEAPRMPQGVGLCPFMDGFPKKGADRKRGLQILLEVAQNLSNFFFWRSLAQHSWLADRLDYKL